MGNYRGMSEEEKKEKYRKDMLDMNKKIQDLAASFKEKPENVSEFLQFGSKFYQYSVKNNMLIYSQNPNTTYVQSYKAWKDNGYSVKKGQKHLDVLVPVKVTYLKDEKGYVKLSEAPKELREAYKRGEVESQSKISYKLGAVFDISQTTCPAEEYPKFFSMGYPSELHGKLCVAIEKYAEEKGIEVEYKDVQSISLRGTYNRIENRIRISDKLEDTERLSTLTHELGHALIHSRASDKSTAQVELEADALSIMLQSDMGIEITETRRRHLALQMNTYRAEIEEEAEKENIEMELSVQDVLAPVYKVYRECKEGLEQYIENELDPTFVKDKLRQRDRKKERGKEMALS